MNNRAIVIALVISLILNVFVIGAAVGAIGAQARLMPRRPPLAAGMGGNPIIRAGDQLPDTVREAYRQRMRSELEAGRPLMQDARAARVQAADAFAQPTFDKAAALAALAKSRTEEAQAREKLETAVVDFASNLPQDQRQQLSRALRQPPRPGGPGMGRRGGGFGPPAGFGAGPVAGGEPK